jgi:plastocyanin
MSLARPLMVATAAFLVLTLAGPAVALANDDLEPVSGSADAVITITGNGVSPGSITVQAGDVVEFRNRDDDRHRMRSRSGPVEFDTDDLESGQSVRFRFSASGTYPYVDERDDDITAYHGRIVVEAAGGSSGGGGSAGSGDGGSGGGGGGGSTGGSTTGGSTATSATVSIGDDFYSPTAVRIAAGGTVTFRNEGEDEHSATSTGGGPIDSGPLSGGASYRATFPAAGTFAFLCIFHSDMQGTVTVVVDGAVPTAPSSPPKPAPTPAATPVPSPTPSPSASSDVIVDGPLAAAVEAADLEFRPSSVVVGAGGTVTWTNVGQAPHTVTAGDGSFDSGMIASGDTFAQTFASAGVYAYVCSFHPGMTGTVEVVAATAAGEGAGGTGAAGAGAVGAAPTPSDGSAGTPAAVNRPAQTAVPDTDAAAVASLGRGMSPSETIGAVAGIIGIVVASILFVRVLRGTVRSARP